MNNNFFDQSWGARTSTGITGSWFDGRHPVEVDESDCQELIDSIVEEKAVIYLGAGASRAAGLPDWQSFLYHLESEVRRTNPKAADSVLRRIQSGDFLVAAEMLQNQLNLGLQEACHELFGNASIPTSIHRAIATIPFSLAVTTNYDCLLESAYSRSVPRLTWQNPLDVLVNLRSKIFCVLKLHGDFSIRESVVLTQSHYRNLMNVNNQLVSCLKMLLATKTFLFCGVSFSDPDLLSLMDEAKSLYGKTFGPHFAISPQAYYDSEYAEILESNYNIRTLVAQEEPDERNSQVERVNLITDGVAQLISHIGARASYHGRFQSRFKKQRKKKSPFNGEDWVSVSQCESSQIGWLLEDIVQRIGASYGCVHFTSPLRPEHRVLYEVAKFKSRDEEAVLDYSFEFPCTHGLLQTKILLQRKIDSDYVFLSDIENAIELSREQGYQITGFTPGSRSSSSSLLVPIYSDGRRTGILTIEAEEGFRFSKFHLKLCKHFAELMGNARSRANQVATATRSLKQYGDSYGNFQVELRRSRNLDDLGIRTLLYQIDPYRGSLYAALDDEQMQLRFGKQWKYSLNERSLACAALQLRRTVREPRSEEVDIRPDSSMAKTGRDAFNISGPTIAFPVHVQGVTAGVFVVWSEKSDQHVQMPFRQKSIPNSSCRLWRKNFWRAADRSRRMIHLIANEPVTFSGSRDGPAMHFLLEIADGLKPVDDAKTWTEEMVSSCEFRQKVIDTLLSVIVSGTSGLTRARFFIHQEKDEQVVCVGSRYQEQSMPPKKYRNNQPIEFVGKEIKLDDFISQTLFRSEWDPYARIQDSESVGGAHDPSLLSLHKALGEPWIVVPVGPQMYYPENGVRRGMKSYGYIAADDFRWCSKEKKILSSSSGIGDLTKKNELIVFQRYCLDLIADILAPLARHEWEFRQNQKRT